MFPQHAFGPGYGGGERTGGGDDRPDIETMSDIEDVFREVSDGKREVDAYQLQSVLNNCFTQGEWAGWAGRGG